MAQLEESRDPRTPTGPAANAPQRGGSTTGDGPARADARPDERAGMRADTGEEIAEEDIRRRAYDLYLARGDAGGSETDDWLAAERELRERRGAGEQWSGAGPEGGLASPADRASAPSPDGPGSLAPTARTPRTRGGRGGRGERAD